jgi:phosphoribosylformylglycinamidine cyclo-ligase
VHAAAHVTGGGLLENLPRALPEDIGAEIRRGSWHEPAVFAVVKEAAGASDQDLFATFNMGIGMVLVVEEERSDQVLARSPRAGRIGVVDRRAGVRLV